MARNSATFHSALLLAIMFACALTAVTAQTRRETLCIFGRSASASSHAAFAAKYYADLFPAVQFDFKVLYPASDLRSVVQSFLANGSTCKFLSITGNSPNAGALSPLVPVSVSWIDGYATATELSDAVAHTSFGRVIPTDSVAAGALAVLATRFSWKMASVVFVDTSYGRSVAEGFSNRLRALGGQIEFSRSFGTSDSIAAIRTAFLPILEQAKSRVIYVGGATPDMFTYFEQEKLWTKVILMFSESSCTAASMARVPGAICATYGNVPQLEADYLNAFRARDKTVDYALFAGVFTTTQLNAVSTVDVYASMTIDAVRAGMEAITNYPSANRTRYANLSSFTKTVSFAGLTGTVSFKGNDRVEAILYYYNSQPNATNTSQYLRNVGGLVANGSIVPNGSPLYYSLENIGYATMPPAGMKPIPAEPKEFPAWILAIIIPAVVLIAAAIGHTLWRRAALARCPLDATQPYTCMFVSIKNEDAVRDRHPADAADAFAKIAGMVKRVVRSTGCHEARRINETTVLVVSKKPEQALECASQIQLAVSGHAWELELHRGQARMVVMADNRSTASSRRTKKSTQSQRTKKSDTGTTKTKESKGSSNPEHTGLAIPRINIGIQIGLGEIDRDEDSGVISYHGAVVDQAAFIADAAVGGQIAVSERLVEVLGEANYNADGVFTDYRAISVPAPPTPGFANKKDKLTVVLQTYMPANFIHAAQVQDRIAAAISVSDSDDACGGIAAALSQAENGFARRRVAVACVYIPSILNADNKLNDAEHARRLTQVLTEIAEVAKQHKGKIQCVSDGRIYIVVNASGPPVSQPETRAANIATYIVHDLVPLDSTFRGTTVGIATGRSMEGTVAGVTASVGTAMNTARIMQQLCVQLDMPCLADDRSYDDLNASYHVVTVDAVAIPTSCDSKNHPRISRVLALVEQRDNAADGEWLYHMDGAKSVNRGETCDTTSAESVWQALAKGTTPQEGIPALPARPPQDMEMPAGSLHHRQEVSHARLADVLETGSLDAYARKRARELAVVY
jgi:ABC-type branched-subunit amino acid transport system substrate-binding protein